jgi:multicomponent Na+:H+ antiporter subunit B
LKHLKLLPLLAFFGVLVWASLSLPVRGDHRAPSMQVVGPAEAPSPGTYYTLNAYKQTHTKNIVTAVLADYRAFDTLGESLVVFVAGVAVALLLGRKEEEP